MAGSTSGKAVGPSKMFSLVECVSATNAPAVSGAPAASAASSAPFAWRCRLAPEDLD
jgi:hypothetical protein